jgi:hypothetical protein
MDDPSLAAALEHTALDGGIDDEARSLTYWVMEGETGAGSATVGSERASETSSDLLAPTAPAVHAEASDVESVSGSVPRRRVWVIRLVVGVFLGVCTGGGVIWIAGWDRLTTLSGSAAAGLLVGFWWTWRTRAN